MLVLLIMSKTTSTLSKQTDKNIGQSELDKFRLFFEYVQTGTKKEERQKAAHRILRPRRTLPLSR